MKTILVVDDMPAFRDPIAAVLRGEGFAVLTAVNGRDALAIILADPPDLVLLDLRMPVKDGLAVLRRMHDSLLFKQIPVLVLEGKGDQALARDASRYDIAGSIAKHPFSLIQLLERVRIVLDASAPAAAATPQSAAPEPDRAPAEKTTRRRKADKADKADRAESDLESLRPIITRSELLEHVSAVSELQSLSPIVSQILELTSGEKHSVDQLAKVVAQDYGLALKILKLANSSIYSRGYQVDTVHKAVGRIGSNNIRQVALGIGVIEHFESQAFRRQLNTALFWEHSITCGLIAAELAHALKHKDADRAFTAGLLHDLGRIICAEALGDRYVQVLEIAEAMQAPLELVEARLLVLNHAEVMATILNAWRFPKNLVNPIVFHHASPGDLKALREQLSMEILRLTLSDRLAHGLLLGSSGNDTIYPTEEHCRLLGVGPATVRRIEETARQQTGEMVSVLLSNSNAANAPRRVEHYRAGLSAPLRPLYVSAAPGVDACRMFCETLAGAAAEGPPNLAVVHFSGLESPAEMARQLGAREEAAGVHGLPALVLSPADQCSLNRNAWSGRTHQALSTPLSASRFIAAANAMLAAAAGRAAA